MGGPLGIPTPKECQVIENMNSLKLTYPDPLNNGNMVSLNPGNFFTSNGLYDVYTDPACNTGPSYRRFNGPGTQALWNACFAVQRLWPAV